MVTREDCIKIGKVIKSHNLQGEVVIASDNDLLEQYADEPVFVQLDGGPVPFFIADEGLAVRNSNSYIVKFDFVDDQKQAEHLVGCDVMLEKSVLDESDISGEGEPGWADFAIFDERTGETGRVTDIADYSGNVVLSVEISGKEILLPFSDAYVRQVDPEHKKITAWIPQDIVDLY